MLTLVTPADGLLPKQLLQSVRRHTKYSTDSEDTGLLEKIIVALAYCEKHSGRCFEEQTWREDKACFPKYLVRSPVTEIVSLDYYDDDNTLTALEDYDVLTPTYQRAQIVVTEYPSVYERPDAVQITYKTSWNPPPAQLLHAVRMLVAHWDNATEAVEFGVLALLGQISLNHYK